jgi:hypothetical protein
VLRQELWHEGDNDPATFESKKGRPVNRPENNGGDVASA